MNHCRFASSASVGELIVNFNNPGFSIVLNYYIQIVLLKNIYCINKIDLTFISWSKSFWKLGSKRPKLQRDRHRLHILLSCLHVQAHCWHLQERCESQKLSSPSLKHLSFLNQNPCGSLQGMRCPLTQRLRQLWSKLTEKST